MFRGTQLSLNRTVAVKEYIPDAFGDKKIALSLVNRECSALVRLSHQNIPTVFDTFSENGTYYVVMEYIDGESLNSEMNIGFKQAVSIVDEICSAVSYLHSQKINHCDLKPDNILVDPNGHIHLIDFGISNINTNKTNVSAGSYGFSAPEILVGKASTPLSDIYSIGQIMMFLFDDTSRHSPYQKQNDDYVSIAQKASMYAPEERYPSAEALRADIAAMMDYTPPRIEEAQPASVDTTEKPAVNVPEESYPSAETHGADNPVTGVNAPSIEEAQPASAETTVKPAVNVSEESYSFAETLSSDNALTGVNAPRIEEAQPASAGTAYYGFGQSTSAPAFMPRGSAVPYQMEGQPQYMPQEDQALPAKKKPKHRRAVIITALSVVLALVIGVTSVILLTRRDAYEMVRLYETENHVELYKTTNQGLYVQDGNLFFPLAIVNRSGDTVNSAVFRVEIKDHNGSTELYDIELPFSNGILPGGETSFTLKLVPDKYITDLSFAQSVNINIIKVNGEDV